MSGFWAIALAEHGFQRMALALVATHQGLTHTIPQVDEECHRIFKEMLAALSPDDKTRCHLRTLISSESAFLSFLAP